MRPVLRKISEEDLELHTPYCTKCHRPRTVDNTKLRAHGKISCRPCANRARKLREMK